MAEGVDTYNIIKSAIQENLCRAIVLLLSAAILYATIVPVQQRWGDANGLVSYHTLASLAIGCVLAITRRLQFHFSFKDCIIGVWFLHYIQLFYTGNVYPCNTTFLQICQLALLFVALRILFSSCPIDSTAIILLLIVGSAYEGIVGISQCVNGGSRHYLYLLTGTFQNPGPFSAYLAMGVAMCCSVIRYGLSECGYKIGGYGIESFVYFPLFICASLLPATCSRAAFVALLPILLWIYRDRYYKFRYLVWTGGALGGIALYLLKQGSADGRLLTWAAALTSWSHHPLFGTGIGSFLHTTAEGIAELHAAPPQLSLFASGGVTDYAFCDLLKVLVEQGLVGAMLCIVSVVSVMRLLWLQCKPLFYGMLSLLIFSMFSYPFELLPFRIIAVVVAAWAVSRHSRTMASPSRKWTILPLLLIVPSMFLVKEVSAGCKADKDYQLFAGMTNEAFIKDYYELLPMERDNARFLFDFGKTLRLHGRYNDSNDMLRQGTLVSADPMFYVLMGNNYKDMGHFDLADEAYNKAFSVMPNRLYPLYQLMRLHWDAGELAKAREYASRIVSFKEKIPSPATEQMKQEAKEYLYNHKQYKQNQTATDSI